MRSLRAHFDAGLATNAFFGIDHPDVAVLGADMTGACRAKLHAEWFGTLFAHMHDNVLGIFIEDGPVHLNPGQR